jgi:hypothetical protein
MSGTTNCTPCSDPGSIRATPYLMTIEHLDPGGVS